MAKRLLTEHGVLIVPSGYRPSFNCHYQVGFPGSTVDSEIREIEEKIGRKMTEPELDEYFRVSTMSTAELDGLMAGVEGSEEVDKRIKDRVRAFTYRLAPCQCGASSVGSNFHSQWCPKANV